MNKGNNGKKIMNKDFDLTSNPLRRVFGHYLLSRMVPLGCYQRGGGMKCLLVLSVSSYFGRPIFWFTTRFERTMGRLQRLRARLPFV